MELNVFPDDVNMGEGGAPTDLQHSSRPDDGQLTAGTAPPPPPGITTLFLRLSFSNRAWKWASVSIALSSALKSRFEFVVPDS